jgi:hypothetical protein
VVEPVGRAVNDFDFARCGVDGEYRHRDTLFETLVETDLFLFGKGQRLAVRAFHFALNRSPAA